MTEQQGDRPHPGEKATPAPPASVSLVMVWGAARRVGIGEKGIERLVERLSHDAKELADHRQNEIWRLEAEVDRLQEEVQKLHNLLADAGGQLDSILDDAEYGHPIDAKMFQRLTVANEACRLGLGEATDNDNVHLESQS